MAAVIRSAAKEDLPALAALKAEYFTCWYQGFAQAELLRKACPSMYLPELDAWLKDPLCHVDILQNGEQIVSYIVYRREAVEPAGWIVEDRHRSCRDSFSQEGGLLIDRAMIRLRQEGCAVVRAWLLKSNYRLRFVYESRGFRPDGERRFDERDGQCFEMVRYLYRL